MVTPLKQDGVDARATDRTVFSSNATRSTSHHSLLFSFTSFARHCCACRINACISAATNPPVDAHFHSATIIIPSGTPILTSEVNNYVNYITETLFRYGRYIVPIEDADTTDYTSEELISELSSVAGVY
jgi:hypothetical protein